MLNVSALADVSTDITAIVRRERTVTVQPVTHGTVIVLAPLQVCDGDTVTFILTPDEGYVLSAAYCGGVNVTAQMIGNTYTVSVSGDIVFSAVFTAKATRSAVTVPVSGSGRIAVSASVSGNTVAIEEIRDAELEKVAGGERVVIDLTGLSKPINVVKLPTAAVKKIAAQSGMSVKLTAAAVAFDKAAAREIAAQSGGSTVELVADDIKAESLNAAQQKTVKTLDAALIIDAHLVSNGKRLCSEESGGFGGGKATVVLPYTLKSGSTPANYSVFYVDEAGKLEKLNAQYDTALQAFVFEIRHFSVYALAYSAACPQDGTCPLAKFTDLNLKAWYHDGIHYCVENGLMVGVSGTQFKPADSITRAMIVTILWRLEGEPDVNYAMSFTDVAPGQWYTEAIRWAQANKIVEGYSAEKFGTNDPITREQMAAILYRYAQTKGYDVSAKADLSKFADSDKIGSWAVDAIAWANVNKLVTGVSTTELAPQGKATREQVAAILHRFCENIVK